MHRHVRLASRLVHPTRLSTPSTARRIATTSYYHEAIAGLTEDQSELRQAVKAFAEAEVAPLAEKTDKENAFPNVRQLEDGESLRLLWLTVRV